jgi:hypothetical protein
MSQALTRNITVICAVIATSASVFAFVQGYAILPYRMEKNEQDIKVIKDDARTSREILIRIEERVKQVQLFQEKYAR